LPEKYSVRLSLCCGKTGCRKRVLPKSVLFDGRKVYWRVVIWITILMRQQRTSTMRQLQEELKVDLRTIRRWISEYRQDFATGRYKTIGGRFPSGLKAGQEVSELFSFFATQNDSVSGVVRLLKFIVENEHLDPGSGKSTQKIGSFQDSK